MRQQPQKEGEMAEGKRASRDWNEGGGGGHENYKEVAGGDGVVVGQMGVTCEVQWSEGRNRDRRCMPKWKGAKQV